MNFLYIYIVEKQMKEKMINSTMQFCWEQNVLAMGSIWHTIRSSKKSLRNNKFVSSAVQLVILFLVILTTFETTQRDLYCMKAYQFLFHLMIQDLWGMKE